VLTFTQALQAVLPGAVRTEFWDGSGIELSMLPEEWIMSSEDAVNAALAGLDAGEAVTIPSLPDTAVPDTADLDTLEGARQALAGNLSRSVPADRYLK
jgi:short-subunit dehydrogenase